MILKDLKSKKQKAQYIWTHEEWISFFILWILK